MADGADRRLADAYGDLALGLRDLARSLQAGDPAGAPAADAPRATSVRDVVAAPVAGLTAVLLQAAVAGAVATGAFQLWMVLAPPLRGSL